MDSTSKEQIQECLTAIASICTNLYQEFKDLSDQFESLSNILYEDIDNDDIEDVDYDY